MVDSIVAALGIYAGTLVIGVLSGLVPVVNGELYLIGVVLLTKQHVLPAIVLALVVAIGQMIAKIILYKAAAGATVLGKDSRLGRRILRARGKVADWRDKPLAITFVSAVFGLPPFYLVTLLAAVLGVRFRAFLILGIIGRTIRFVAITLIVLAV